jgi:hypothetical protein
VAYSYKKGLNKVVVPPDCCGCCSNIRHSDRKDCPTEDNLCSCGIKGHFRKYCYRNGKKRMHKVVVVAIRSPRRRQETKEETSHGIGESCFALSESCFSLHAMVETNRGPCLSTGPNKTQPTMPTINLPEDVILASLQYSEGNDRWVDRAKDESSNKLHVLIKPMQEQWDKLHDDPSCTPTRSKMKKTQSAGIADAGASVLCSGTNLMRQLGLEERNLCKTTTVIRTATEAKLERCSASSPSLCRWWGTRTRKASRRCISPVPLQSMPPGTGLPPQVMAIPSPRSSHVHQSQKRTWHHVAAQKFQFGSKTVAWAGFTIRPDSVKPLPKHTEAAKTYPTPVNITDMRSFIALLQQVAYCYAISPAVAKLRHLLKPTEPWDWTEDIDNAFKDAKKVRRSRRG